MNKNRLLEFLSHKTWLWKRVFCNMYIGQHHLYDLRLKTEPEPEMFVRLCQNSDDLSEIWNLAEFLDFHEGEISDVIADLSLCRPIPWQYDFVQKISDASERKILQTLRVDAIVDAYCAAMISRKIDLSELFEQLDETYVAMYKCLSQKQELLKRNFSLILETKFSSRYGGNAWGLNFREIVDLYVSSCGVKGIAEVLKKAQTSETKLTSEERACQAFAYCSPYFCSEVGLEQNKMPESSIFACVEDYLQDMRKRWDTLQETLMQARDEDEEDEIRDMMELKHNAVYVDPQERCLMDVRLGQEIYANVYVQRFPQDYMNNSLPDFIRYHKGCLYTVEFIDDISELDVAQDMLQRLNAVKCEMLKIEKAALKDPRILLVPKVQLKMQQLQGAYASCYYALG